MQYYLEIVNDYIKQPEKEEKKIVLNKKKSRKSVGSDSEESKKE